MKRMEFTQNNAPTLGVEVELQLVDADTMALKSCIEDVLRQIPKGYEQSIKPELMQSYLEINTNVCQTVADADKDLRAKIKIATNAAERSGARFFWSGTHPFSPWQEQQVTPDERYLRLVELLQDTARRLVAFGLHVHVGVDNGDKAVMICDRIMRHLPTLLALSVNSPFWIGRNSGLNSQRSKVMEGLPTAGLPPLMRNWSEYVWLIRHLVETKFIETIREIWWDVRPHHNFGTVEVRICDMPPNLDDTLALVALIQCLVHALSTQIDEGTYQFDCHPMVVRQNKWRACRYGMDAMLVDPYTLQIQPARQLALDLVKLLEEHAKTLRCENYLQRVREIINKPSGAQRQIDVFQKTSDLAQMVRYFVDQGEAGGNS